MKDERLYLIHIAECIEKIEQYTTEGKAVFLRDTKTQDAVIRNFEIIGEAVTPFRNYPKTCTSGSVEIVCRIQGCPDSSI